MWTAGTVALLIILATICGLWLTRRSFPETDGTLRLAGLESDVTVLRDEHGIPQITARTAPDLFFAQGFVHAQDRFWEMDVRRHVTSGRLSELFGESQVETDSVLRAMDWRGVAEREVDLLDDETVAMLDAYAAGVNAYLDGRSETEVSLEYAVLALSNRRYEIEPWTPVDSVAWLKAMAWDLRGNMQEEIERSLIAAEVGVDRTEQLYPAYPYDEHDPIVTSGRVVGGEFDPAAERPTAPPVPAAARPVLADLHAALGRLPALLGPQGDGLGSNSWVLAGSRTTTGAPLLANDPHLGPSIPSIWTQVGLRCAVVSAQCPYDVAGFSFSGLPGVVIGHNDRITWGFTNLGPDVSDLYLEQIEDGAAVVDGQRRPVDERRVTIEVAGGAPREIVVRSTAHGPILSDVSDEQADVGASAPAGADAPSRGDGYAVALSWTALEPGRTMDALRLMNTARDWETFRQAASRFEVPAQNIVYADVDGNIGYQAPGVVPIRGAGDGRWPAPGWDSAYDWVGEIPAAELPFVLNPGSGYVVTANNAVVGPDYPYLLTDDWSWGSRSQRLVDLLEEADGPLSLEDMQRMQTDTWSEAARILVPALRSATEGGGADAFVLLDGWDLRMEPDSAPAALFAGVWRSLMSDVFDDELPEDVRASGGDRWVGVVDELLQRPDDRWWDDVRSDEVEDRDEMLRRVLSSGDAEVVERLGDDRSAWRWADLHRLELENATLGTSGIAPVEWLFNRGPVGVGGGRSIVNATGWTAYDGFEVDWVPSMRMVIDLADLDASTWVNLTGASGHAFHPHYWDQTDAWRDGRTTPWPFSSAAVEAAHVDRLVLSPAREPAG